MRRSFLKAGIGAGMANGANGAGFDQQRIRITIQANAFHFQEIAGAFALGPEPALAATPEGNPSLLLGLLQGLGIHVAEHEHFLAHRILHNGGHKAVGFGKVGL
jgi:hypothetical protein